MKVLIKQLGGIQPTVECAEDALAGILSLPDCVFAYVDIKEKRTVSFHPINLYPPQVVTEELAKDPEFSKTQLFKGQQFVLVRDDSPPESDEDRICVKII